MHVVRVRARGPEPDGWERLPHLVVDPAVVRVSNIRSTVADGAWFGDAMFFVDSPTPDVIVGHVIDGLGLAVDEMGAEPAPAGWEALDIPDGLTSTRVLQRTRADDPRVLTLAWHWDGLFSRILVEEGADAVTVEVMSGDGSQRSLPDDAHQGWSMEVPVCVAHVALAGPIGSRLVADRLDAEIESAPPQAETSRAGSDPATWSVGSD